MPLPEPTIPKNTKVELCMNLLYHKPMKISRFRLGFNIVLLGMIASGKDTQAEILKKKYALKSIESGIYWRKLLKEKSTDGDWVRRTTGAGKPAPVILMKKFLVREIAKNQTIKTCCSWVILD